MARINKVLIVFLHFGTPWPYFVCALCHFIALGTRRDKKRQKSAGKVAIVAIVVLAVVVVLAVLAVIVVVAELSAGGVASRPDLLAIKN